MIELLKVANKRLVFAHNCLIDGVDPRNAIYKIQQFFKRWLKPFGRMVPVGREVSLILRLYRMFKRKESVFDIIGPDTLFIRMESIFDIMPRTRFISMKSVLLIGPDTTLTRIGSFLANRAVYYIF